ncbi:MAG: hypoxanthine phosphoribosyltransferase [Clostridiales bacterium]|nr:hypoxanthine phosphoribosyltransferase [Clostridiales bacterium]
MTEDIAKVLLTEQQIRQRVQEIAETIDRDYRDKDGKLVLLCVLKGSVVFMADLMKAVSLPVDIDFMKVSSYGSATVSSGNIRILLDLHREDIANCHIIIVEDIIDSGRTLSHLTKYLELKGAKSVRTCTLLDKPERREVDFTPDYAGFVIPDEFVVGYGLDYNEAYRELSFVGILKPSVYSSMHREEKDEK